MSFILSFPLGTGSSEIRSGLSSYYLLLEIKSKLIHCLVSTDRRSSVHYVQESHQIVINNIDDVAMTVMQGLMKLMVMISELAI